MSETLITSRDPKGIHIVGLFEAALNKAGLDDAGAQRLIENGGEFQADITSSIRKHSVSNQFADEEVESSYGYPSEYHLRGITEQTNRLRELFRGIGYADEELVKRPLPTGAEGCFAIPRWESVAPTYGEAIAKVHAFIKETRDGKFYNYREGQLGEQYLRQSVRTERMFQVLEEQQEGHDILIVPAQFGLRHRGRSVRRGREVFTANEFGLGAFAVGCMLLTHPERLIRREQLHIDCAGDKYAPDADGDFGHAPYFDFRDGKVKFVSDWVDNPHAYYGSASGFLWE